jgi:hypothetical protein
MAIVGWSGKRCAEAPPATSIAQQLSHAIRIMFVTSLCAVLLARCRPVSERHAQRDGRIWAEKRPTTADALATMIASNSVAPTFR